MLLAWTTMKMQLLAILKLLWWILNVMKLILVEVDNKLIYTRNFIKQARKNRGSNIRLQ